MTALRLWPDETEQLLLHAALADGQKALDAFSEWNRRVDLDEPLDGGSFRLLPLVHFNLSRLGHDDPIMHRLRGVYRHSWCEAQAHLRRGGQAIALLRGSGIDVMVSKGLALAADFYPSPALRPMSDIDLYISPDRVDDAVALLRENGWNHHYAGSARAWRQRRRDLLIISAGIGLSHPQQGELDLHWRLQEDCKSSAAYSRFWKSAVPCEIGGVQALRPAATDLLFHVLVHGLRPNVMSPMRWVADATMILRLDGANVDWDDLLAFAAKMRLRGRVSRGLKFLHDQMGIAVPFKPVAARPSIVEAIEERADRASLANGEGGSRWSNFLSFFAIGARLATSEAGRHLPRLVLGWTSRRLRRGLS